MAITETLQGLGEWSLSFENMPREIIDAIKYYGHICVHTGRIDFRQQGDAALSAPSTRYTGVIRKRTSEEDRLDIGGPGMAMWLGDEDQKGEVIEDLLTITNQTFEDTIRALLPDSVAEGTLYNIGKNFTGTFQYLSPREAIDYVAETLDAEWRVRYDGKLDAGLPSDLFVTQPRALIAPNQEGADLFVRAFRGRSKTEQDVKDFSTRVVLLAQGSEGSTATASADLPPGENPFVDLYGNPVKFTRLVSESSTDATNAEARALLQLNRFKNPVDSLSLSTETHQVYGSGVKVGDYIWAWDDRIGLEDKSNQEIFNGRVYNPMKLRLIEMTEPVTAEFSVGYRDPTGKWWNLTDYLVPETGETNLVVGEFRKSLTGADGGVVGPRPQPDTSVPAAPTWVEPFPQSVYQSPLSGETRAQTELQWLRPENTDGSTIVDGDHFEIRYRSATTPIFPVTWAQLEQYTWAEIEDMGGTWENPIQYQPSEWQYVFVPWSELKVLLIDLIPYMPYEAQIRAVDAATPPNTSEWSAITQWQGQSDTIAPVQPAPPTVYASRIAVQIVHELGRSDGGTFNLDADLHHLEVHGASFPDFTPTDETLLGKVMANYGMINGQIPAVGTVPIESTAPVYFRVVAVDTFGNKSNPSIAVQQTAELIDNAHISDLSVSKVTAGTISATWLLAGTIRTAVTGARAEMDIDGFRLYDSANVQTVNMDADTGNVTLIGKISTRGTGQRIEIDPNPNSGIARLNFYLDPTITTDRVSAYFFSNVSMAMENQTADGVTNGGKIQLGQNFGIIGFKNALHDNYLWFFETGNARLQVDGQLSLRSGNGAAELIMGADNFIQLKGRWYGAPMDGQSAVLIGWDDGVPGGPFNVGYGYGATMANRTSPIGSAYYVSDVERCPTMSPSPTGFELHSNLPGTFGWHWWVYRSD